MNCDLDSGTNSTFSDLIDFATVKYKKYRSIIMINKNISFEAQFRFKDVSEDVIQQDVLNMNPEKPGIFSNFPTKTLKRFVDVGNVILQNRWNSEILEK